MHLARLDYGSGNSPSHGFLVRLDPRRGLEGKVTPTHIVTGLVSPAYVLLQLLQPLVPTRGGSVRWWGRDSCSLHILISKVTATRTPEPHAFSRAPAQAGEPQRVLVLLT